MTQQNPYEIVKHRHITEKAVMLQHLQSSDKNPSVRRCKNPKYVFIVDENANKQQITEAVETIYKDKNIKVVAVNTINVKAKPRRVRGRFGFKAGFKKAVVTLAPGDTIDDV